MKRHMYDHYCQQGLRSVAVYIDDFQELRACNGLDKSKSQELMRYTTSLCETLRSQVDVKNIFIFLEAITLVTSYENQLNKSSKFP